MCGQVHQHWPAFPEAPVRLRLACGCICWRSALSISLNSSVIIWKCTCNLPLHQWRYGAALRLLLLLAMRCGRALMCTCLFSHGGCSAFNQCQRWQSLYLQTGYRCQGLTYSHLVASPVGTPEAISLLDDDEDESCFLGIQLAVTARQSASLTAGGQTLFASVSPGSQ